MTLGRVLVPSLVADPHAPESPSDNFVLLIRIPGVLHCPQGRVLEMGSHEELYSQGGEYWRRFVQLDDLLGPTIFASSQVQPVLRHLSGVTQ